MFSISRFQRVMQGLPRGSFQSVVDQHEGDKHTKGFGCLGLLAAHVFGHLSGSRSLRDLEIGFNAHPAQRYHLGIGPHGVRRTTLADASAKRNPAVFEQTARMLMAAASRKIRRQGEECLMLLDSTSFTLKGPGFEWAKQSATRNTQGLKLHIVYDLGKSTPVLGEITAANVNDVTQALGIPLARGATYVFDKGYCDYNWWARFDEQDAKFVTRLKSNAKVEVVGPKWVPEQGPSLVIADEVVRFSNKNPGAGRKNRYTANVRRVIVHRPTHDTPLVLVTNDMERTATEVAECYRARWQIELFFKWIKQNLRIKAFLGRSENAVRIQILCALIAYLLAALYRDSQAPAQSMLRVLNELRVTLFQRPSVEEAVYRRRAEARVTQAAVQPGLFA
mgnify:CR=1 FL=1